MEVETEIIVEEGEITDDEEDDEIEAYNVLERPEELLNSHRPKIIDNHTDEESEVSTDTDSDKGSSRTAKKSKLKKLPPNKPVNKLKKYDVWSARAQEDLLAETLISCDVSKIDRSLGVESYDYTQSNRYKQERRLRNKRKHKDQKNVHLRLGKRDSSTDDEKKGAPRIILDLVSTADSSVEELAKDIANKLIEEKDDLIYKIVKAIGKEKATSLFKDTQNVEANGGVLIMNGTRRRTPGGVYIYLLKKDDDITMEQQNEIFSEDRLNSKLEKKLKDKKRIKNMKRKLLASKEKLPDLPTRVELSINDVKNNEPVKNPPPSPVSEDSSIQQNTAGHLERDLHNYSDEFLDMGVGNDMDIF